MIEPQTAPESRSLLVSKWWLAPGLLVLLAVAAYSNSFVGGFAFDNEHVILKDPRVQSMDYLRLIFTREYWFPTNVTGLYRPVTTLSYLFNCTILGSGDRAFSYHLVNLLLHVANVLMLFALLRRLKLDRFAALIGAALWAVHPLGTEAVTNIIGRADLLAAAAVLGGLLLYIAALEATGSRRRGLLAGVIVVSTLGIFSKENAAVLVALVVVYELLYALPQQYARGGRVAAVDYVRDAASGRWLLLLIPLILLYLARQQIAARSEVPVTDALSNPLVAAPDALAAKLTAIKVLGRYLWLMIWPANLSADYSYNAIPLVQGSLSQWENLQALLALLVLVTLVVLAAVWWKRRPAASMLIALLLISFLPVSNLLVTMGTIMGERLAYLPMAGAAGLAGMGLWALIQWGQKHRPAGQAIVGGVALVVLALGTRTVLRNFDWKSNETLWLKDIQVASNSAKMRQLVAGAIYQKNVDRGLAEAQKGVEIVEALPMEHRPAIIYTALAVCQATKADKLRNNGDLRGAEAYLKQATRTFEQAAALDARDNEAYRAREIAHRGSAEWVRPVGDVDIYVQLGQCYLLQGRGNEAQAMLLKARRLNPGDERTYLVMALLYRAAGQPQPAAVQLLQLYLLNPGNPQLWRELMATYEMLKADGVILKNGDQLALNLQHPMIRGQMDAAAAELIGTALEARQPQLAAGVYQLATQRYGCAEAPLRAAMQPKQATSEVKKP